MCANVDAYSLARVVNPVNRQMLEEFTSKARDHIELTGRSFETSGFYLKLIELLNFYEKKIDGIPEKKLPNVERTLNKDRLPIENYKGYGNWLFNLEKNVRNLLVEHEKATNFDLSKTSYQVVMKSIQQLRKVYKTVECVRLFDSKTALNVLEEENIGEADEVMSDAVVYLKNLERNAPFSSDILEYLLE